MNDDTVGFGDANVDEDGVLTCPLTDDAEVRISARNDGKLVVDVVAVSSSGESPIYTDAHNRDFYSKQTKRTIKNEVKNSHPDGDTIAARFLEFCSALNKNHEMVQKALRPPAANNLLDQTETVEIYGGTTTMFVVTMNHRGRTRELEFTAEEIMGTNPAPLRNKYGSAFYEKVALEPEVWEDLADEWIAMGEEVAAERMTEEEAIAGELATALSRRLSVTLDRDGLANDALTAWYDEENETDNEDVTQTAGRDASVIWVRTEAIRDFLKDSGKGKDYFRDLSPALKGMGMTYTTSTRIRTENGRHSTLGFDPGEDGLGIPRSAAVDTTEVMPE